MKFGGALSVIAGLRLQVSVPVFWEEGRGSENPAPPWLNPLPLRIAQGFKVVVCIPVALMYA
jgi:hypothetical protein